MTLYSEFLSPNHRTCSKWPHYFPIYEKHLSKFRNNYVTLFEIGVAQGGSLQLWKRWLGPNAIIIGIDIHPHCVQVEERQIHVRINEHKSAIFYEDLLKEFGAPDIVIDDGGHKQSEVNQAFDCLFDSIPKNGCYIVEDLHAAYWEDYEGGYKKEGSFIERAKSFVDDINWEYTRGAIDRNERRALRGSRISSVSFYDSIVAIDIGEVRKKLNVRIGNTPPWDDDWKEFTGRIPPEY